MLFWGCAEASTFHLTSGNGVNNGNGTYSFSSDGIGLTVSAGLFADVPNAVISPGANNAAVTQNAVGLGVTSTGDSSGNIDGLGQNDALIFAFDRTVKIEGIWFSGFDLDDDVDFFFESGGQLVRHSTDYLISLAVDLDGFIEASVLLGLFPSIDPNLFIGSMFGFGADDDGVLGLLQDSFRIKGLKVSDLSGPPAEVPIPAAFPLFLAGLAGFRFAMRRGGSPIEA
ncbi:MAG: hypothetical protein VX640_08670 [Pseudomonadota bacterium]|nr:hypothetical protein [Pseudomonadota bacterium]